MPVAVVRPSSSGGGGGSDGHAAAADGGSAEGRGVARDDGDGDTPMEPAARMPREDAQVAREEAAPAAPAAMQAQPGEGSAPRSGRRHSRWGSPVDTAPTPACAAAAGATSSGGAAAGERAHSPEHEAAGAVGAGPSPGAREQEGGAASLLPRPSLPQPLPSASGQRPGLPRPASATFSDVSGGDSGSSGPPQQQHPHHVPLAVPAFLATAAATVSSGGGGGPANGGLYGSLATNGLPGGDQLPHWENSGAAAQHLSQQQQQQQPTAESPPAGDLSFFLRAAVTVQVGLLLSCACRVETWVPCWACGMGLA